MAAGKHEKWYVRAARVAVSKGQAHRAALLQRRSVVRHRGAFDALTPDGRPRQLRSRPKNASPDDWLYGGHAPSIRMFRLTLVRAARAHTPMIRFPDRRAPRGM